MYESSLLRVQNGKLMNGVSKSNIGIPDYYDGGVQACNFFFFKQKTAYEIHR